MDKTWILGLSASLTLTAIPATRTAAAEVAWGTTVSAPAGERGSLFGVATTGPAEVWAVGAYNPGQLPEEVLTNPYAERWNGAAWTFTAVPLAPVYASQSATLAGAAAIGPGGAWAVGHVDDLDSLASQTLAYRWDGSSWQRVPTPNPAGAQLGNHLNAVVSLSADAAWAVGDAGYPAQSLALRWDGTLWSVVASPDIGSLVAITAESAGIAVASSAQVMRFDGTRWKKLPPPPFPQGDGLELAGVASSGSRLWVVGTLLIPYFEGYLYRPYAAVWQASRWNVVSSIPLSSGLQAVAAQGQLVQATSTDGHVVVLTANAGTLAVTPAGPIQLSAIAADAVGNFWAVGERDDQGALSPAIDNAPGIDQGGIRVTTGVGGALVTWIGPATGSGTADDSGRFSVGGLPVGAYQIIASAAGCNPATTRTHVAAGRVRSVDDAVQCGLAHDERKPG
jgi:hypothetical protein